MTTLYNCKSEIDEEGIERYRITKFDGDMNVGSSYLLAYDGHYSGCNCPAGVHPSCRHRDMLPKFIARYAVNSHWFYDYNRGGWISSDVHLEGALANVTATEIDERMANLPEIKNPLVEYLVDKTLEVIASTDPGTQLPIAGERPELYGIGPAMHDLPALREENERRRQELVEVETRRASSTAPLLRRF